MLSGCGTINETWSILIGLQNREYRYYLARISVVTVTTKRYTGTLFHSRELQPGSVLLDWAFTWHYSGFEGWPRQTKDVKISGSATLDSNWLAWSQDKRSQLGHHSKPMQWCFSGLALYKDWSQVGLAQNRSSTYTPASYFRTYMYSDTPWKI